MPIRLSPTPTTSRVLPIARVKLGVSGSGDIASNLGGTGRAIREKSLELRKRPRKRKVFTLRDIHPRFVPSRATRRHAIHIVGVGDNRIGTDTTTATGKAFFDMLGVFAEFETNLRRERQAEGIIAAKMRGVYRGRRATINMEEIQMKLNEGASPTNIARAMGISRGTVYKAKALM